MRFQMCSSVLIACIAFGLAQDADAAELSPTASAFKSDHLDPEVKNVKGKIEKLIGSKVDITVDVASHDKDYGNGSVLADSADVMKGFKNNCFDPLLTVIEELSKTPATKSKLAGKLKKIDIKTTGEADATWGAAVFSGTTLVFKANATTSIEGPYAHRTREVLSAALKGEPKPADSKASGGGSDGRSDEVARCQRGCNRQCNGASNKSKCVGQCRRACAG